MLFGNAGSPFLEASASAGVFRHPQVIEDQADIAVELTHFLWDAARAFGFDDTDGEASKP